ncbi:MAG: AbrB/MazE/SpoVT family DNA-binding domain-containing protein [Bacilli bacterium]
MKIVKKMVNGRLVIPKALRILMNIKPNDKVVLLNNNGIIKIQKLKD